MNAIAWSIIFASLMLAKNDAKDIKNYEINNVIMGILAIISIIMVFICTIASK